MVGAFAKRFEDRYFPLAFPFRWGEVESHDDLTAGIILQVQGLEEDDYHELLEERLGHILASLLVDLEGDLDLGPRHPALMEKAAEAVPRGWLSHAVGGGFTLGELAVLSGKDCSSRAPPSSPWPTCGSTAASPDMSGTSRGPRASATWSWPGGSCVWGGRSGISASTSAR